MASDAETNYTLSTMDCSTVDVLTSDRLDGISTVSVAAHSTTSASRRRFGVPSLWDRDSDKIKHTVFTAVDDLSLRRGTPGRHSLHELPSHRKARLSGVWIAEPLTAPPQVTNDQKHTDYDNIELQDIVDQNASLINPAKLPPQNRTHNHIQILEALPNHPLHFTLEADEELSISISPQGGSQSCPPSTQDQALKYHQANPLDINSNNINTDCFDLYSTAAEEIKSLHHKTVQPRVRYNSVPNQRASSQQAPSGFLITHKPQQPSSSGEFEFAFSYSFKSDNENYPSPSQVSTAGAQEANALKTAVAPTTTAGSESSLIASVSLQNTPALLPGSSINPVANSVLAPEARAQISNKENERLAEYRLENKLLTPEDCYDNLNPENQSVNGHNNRMPASSLFITADMGGDKAQTLPRKFKLSKSEIYHSISTTNLSNVEYNPNAPQITREYVDHIMATSYGDEEEDDMWRTSTFPRRACPASPAIQDEVFIEAATKSPPVLGNSMLAEYFNKRKELSSLSELSSSSPVSSIHCQNINKHNKCRLNSFPDNNKSSNAHFIENHSSGKRQTLQSSDMSNSASYRNWSISPRTMNGALTADGTVNGYSDQSDSEDEQILQVVMTPTSYNDDTPLQPPTPTEMTRSPYVNNLDHNCNQTVGNLSRGGYTLVNGSSCSSGFVEGELQYSDSVFTEEEGDMESERKLAEHQLILNEIRCLEYQLQRVSDREAAKILITNVYCSRKHKEIDRLSSIMLSKRYSFEVPGNVYRGSFCKNVRILYGRYSD